MSSFIESPAGLGREKHLVCVHSGANVETGFKVGEALSLHPRGDHDGWLGGED